MPTYMTPEDAENGLTVLLLRAVPENQHGHKTIDHLATLWPISRHSIHKWLRKGRIPPNRVLRVVEIGKLGEPKGSPGRVRQSDFDPFVYKV